jgi:outer membrane protein OmpA-like peptidoglycan-associated protein/tetratricopeptide (TPR) repeat protein
MILLIGFIVNTVNAQPVKRIDKLNSRKLKKLGYKYKVEGDIYGALEFFKRLNDKQQIGHISYELALLNYKSRDYEKAGEYYIASYLADNVAYLDCLYYYGLMLKYQGLYNEAIKQFKNYKAETEGFMIKFPVDYDILGCEMAMTQKADPKISIVHFDKPINSPHLELSPIFSKEDEILFTSIREDTVRFYEPGDSLPKARLYYAIEKNNEWEFKGIFDIPGIEPDAHIGNPSFSLDKQRLYFSKCQKVGKNKVCNICMSRLKDGQYQEPVDLFEDLKGGKTYTQPHVYSSNDDNTVDEVFFVSNRNGSMGGLDIWTMSFHHDADTVGKIQNLGARINTIGDEVTPTFNHKENKLFFSSMGHPGYGGFDIFYSIKEIDNWAMPVNIKKPINSSVDDLYYYSDENNERAFITSNRVGIIPLLNPTCCDDIFLVKYPVSQYVDISGKVFFRTEEGHEDVLEQAEIFIYEIQPMGRKPLIAFDESGTGGVYNVRLQQNKKYEIVARKDGYFSDKTEIVIDADTKEKQAEKIVLIKVSKKSIVLQNIYYEYGKHELTLDSKKILDTTLYVIMTENKDFIIEISSHTDSVSSHKFNMKLSQRRAESVVAYLASKGIPRKRMIAKGYGETKPIVPNSNPDGTDNEKNRAINRRTEFKVVGSSNMKSKLNVNDFKIVND